MCESVSGQGAREGLWGWSNGPSRNDYEASGEFGVRTERPKREGWIGEEELP